MKYKYIFLFVVILLTLQEVNAQSVWTPVTSFAPDSNEGNMILLSDGRVLAKSSAGGGDGIGNTWNILTPDINGSYINGTWSSIAPMHGTRLYYSSQILKDGRLYVAGGEYGTGFNKSEIYDPLTNIWQQNVTVGDTFYDANSNILPDGKVLQQLIQGNYLSTAIFNPATNTYSPAANCLYYPSEGTWVQLPDNSILFIDLESKKTERYIPSLNQWVRDSSTVDSIWWHWEMGPAVLLPNGKVINIGASGHTGLYTPSGSNSPGMWAAGPDLPNGTGTADAPAAMMANGKVMTVAGPKPISDTVVFLSPVSFYTYDYIANTWSQIAAPVGLDTAVEPAFVFNLLNLPDGSVMLSEIGSQRYNIYTPQGPPTPSGKPSIDSIKMITCGKYLITGELFNGISQGQSYGDDFQAASNYPIVRLTTGGKVYYARTFNWNHTGVMMDSVQDTATFTLPYGLPPTTDSLVVIVNGISSNPVMFTPCLNGVPQIENSVSVSVYPNPANREIRFLTDGVNDVCNIEIYNMMGQMIAQNKEVKVVSGVPQTINISGIAAGQYMLRISGANCNKTVPFIVTH